MYFYPYGPFEIIRDKLCISENKDDKSEFWQNVEEKAAGLSDACGCYIFTIHNKVWYVGRTKKQDFKGECFTNHKLKNYNKALTQHKGKPRLMLIARCTDADRFSQPSDRHGDIGFLEKMLIGLGLKRNPDLLNIKDTKLLREMIVPGVINTWQGGGNAKSIQFLKQYLGIR